MHRKFILLIGSLFIVIIFLILTLTVSANKKREVCPESKTCPIQCSPCPGRVNLDKLLYKLPEGVERYPSLSTTKSLTNIDNPCTILDSTNLNTSKKIDIGQSGLLQLNQDTATKDKYKYVWRPYRQPTIASSLDFNYYAGANHIVEQICPELKATTLFGTELRCNSNTPGLGVRCPTGFTCKLDGNENENNACI